MGFDSNFLTHMVEIYFEYFIFMFEEVLSTGSYDLQVSALVLSHINFIFLKLKFKFYRFHPYIRKALTLNLGKFEGGKRYQLCFKKKTLLSRILCILYIRLCTSIIEGEFALILMSNKPLDWTFIFIYTL